MKICKKIIAIVLAISVCLSVSVSASAAAKNADSSSYETTAADSAAASDEADDEDSDKENYSFSEKTVGNAELIANEEVLTDNGQFQFIAVTTRDGDVFYVIVDNSKEENNVYFLNDVDTYDLQALLNKDEDGNSAQVGATEATDTDVENADTEEEADKEKEKKSANESGGFSSIFILIGIVVLGGIGFVIFKLKTGGFGKKKASTDLLDDEFDDDEEINEDNEQ